MLTYQPKLSSNQLDAVFSALAHPIRRAIIEQVAEDQTGRTVNELAQPHSISRPAISQHLRVLENAGLIEQTIEGRIRRCNLQVEPLSAANSWLEKYRIYWENALDRIQEIVENEPYEDE